MLHSVNLLNFTRKALVESYTEPDSHDHAPFEFLIIFFRINFVHENIGLCVTVCFHFRLLGEVDAFDLGHTFDPKTFGIWI